MPDRSTASELDSTAPQTAAEADAIAEGTRLGRYVVLQPIGRGANGFVVAGWDTELDRKIAIKFLHRSLEQRDRQRLQHEAKALARLTHPNVIRVHDVGHHDGRLYMVMELVDGPTLATWARNDPHDTEILRVMIATGQGLAAAHDAGIVHRDFKPANVLIGSDGRPRVTDFGHARGGRSDSAPADARPEDPLDVTLTRSGALVGTPAYMAPELFEGLEADARSDQFSFCVALYELLYGRRPFAGDTLFALADSVLAGRMRIPGPRTHVPLRVRAAVIRGLSRAPADRFPDMPALLRQLAILPVWRTVGFAAGVTAALFAGAIALGREPSAPDQDYCGGVEQRIAAIWNADRDRAIESAIAATGVPYGADVTARLRGILDPYVADLRSAERSTCEAQSAGTLPVDVATARMLCLHRRREEARGLVDLLERADAGLVEHAIEAATSLAPVSTCTDARIGGPRWSSADEAVVYELETAISRTRIAAEAWRDDSAKEQAIAAAEAARAAGQPWYEAEAEELLAHVLDRAGESAAAESHFDAAFAAALATEHHRVATKAALGIAGSFAARGDQINSKRWLEHAVAAAGRDEAAARHWPQELANARGQLAYHSGDYATALEHFEAALAEDGAGGLREGPILLNIGVCQVNLGHYEPAIAALERSLAEEEAAFGPEHPALVRPLNAICHVQTERGAFAEAIAACQRAIDILRATGDGPQARLSHLYTNLGSAHFRAGRSADAELAQLAALDNAERAQPDDATLHAMIHNNLGVLYGDRRELESAESHYRRGRDLLVRTLGPDHPSTAMLETNLAMVLGYRGKYDEAEAMLHSSLERMQARLGPEHPDLALSYAELARVHVGKGDHAAAVPLFERAIALRAAAGGDPNELADSSWGLAQSLAALDPVRHRERMRALARQAAALYREVGGERAAHADEVEAWLAARSR